MKILQCKSVIHIHYISLMFKPADDVVYDECQQPTAVYKTMHN